MMRALGEGANLPFLRAGGMPAEFVAALDCAITKGWLWRHESGTYLASRKPVQTCSREPSTTI